MVSFFDFFLKFTFVVRFFDVFGESGRNPPNANCVYLAFGFSGFFILKTFFLRVFDVCGVVFRFF